jgi:hypothetical protein
MRHMCFVVARNAPCSVAPVHGTRFAVTMLFVNHAQEIKYSR